MSPLQTINHYIKTKRHYLASAFDTGGDSLLKHHILLAAFCYCIGLVIQTTHLVRFFSGELPQATVPWSLLSIFVLLSGLYLLVIKKRHWLSIYIVVVYLIIRQNSMLSMNLSGTPMLGIAWVHAVAFVLVFMLGIKKSIVPVAIYSGSLILQIILGLDNSADDGWDTSSLLQFIYIHFIVLSIAYFNEWSITRAFKERDQAREQEQNNTAAYARHVEMLLDNKKQLLVDVSHELRTPLSVLKANIEAMEDGINHHEESYPVIHRKLNQIDRLIQDIYFISKSDAQQLVLYVNTIVLSELIDELMLSFRPLADEKGLILSVNDRLNNRLHNDASNDIRIEGDRQRLIQLFSNLLQNSLDYTDRGGKINLSSRAVRSGVEITIQDSAPGVPEQEHSQLFERLYRKESSRNRATGGSGLGLSICRAIVEAHNGSITITTSPLGGLSITSWLPFAQPANTVTTLK